MSKSSNTAGPQILTNNLIFGFDSERSSGFIKTPKQISNLLCWIDAADSSSFTISQSLILLAGDKSGNNYNFVAPNSASSKCPDYITSSLNGLPCIRTYSDVAGNRVLWNTSLNLQTSDFTIFGVFKKTNDADANGRVLGGYNNNWLLGFWSSYEDQAYYNAWIYGAGAGAPYNLTPSRTISPKIYVAKGRSDNTDVLAKRNGLVLFTGSNSNDGPNGIVLGAYLSTLSEPSYSDFNELLVYNRALSHTEIVQLEKYLSNKWNIPLIQSSASFQTLQSSVVTATSPEYSKGTFTLTDSFSYIDTLRKWTDITTAPQTSSLSISTWVRPLKRTIGGSYGSIIHQLESLTVPNTDSRGGFHLRVNEDLTVAAEYGTNTFYHTHTSTNKLIIGRWHHLVSIRNQYSSSLYIDGRLDSVSIFSSGSWLNAANTNMVIGRGWASNNFKFNGDIGSLQIYETPLTQNDVSFIYNNYSNDYVSKTSQSLVSDGLVTYIDANNVGSYPQSGNTVYTLTGSQNFNFTSSGVNLNEPKFFDCSGTYGALKRSASVEPNLGNDLTIIVWAKPISSTANWRTMTRGYGVDHHLLIEFGGNTIGFYDNGSNTFLASTGSNGTAYSILNITNFSTEYNSYELILSSTTPEWQLFLNGESGSRATISSSLISNNTHSVGTIGGFTSVVNEPNPLSGSSQYFGYIGCALIYNRKLSNAERLQNYLYFRTRFGK